MRIEFVEFYVAEEKGQKIKGTCHIRLPEYGIEIRGIGVVGSLDGKLFYFMPSKTIFDERTKKSGCYPVVVFTDPELNDSLMEQIKLELPFYIAKRLFEGAPRVRHISPKKKNPPRKKVFKKPFKKRTS